MPSKPSRSKRQEAATPEPMEIDADVVEEVSSAIDDDVVDEVVPPAASVQQYSSLLVRDEGGMHPTNLLTGYYGTRGERIRHVVLQGALRLPATALDLLLTGTDGDATSKNSTTTADATTSPEAATVGLGSSQKDLPTKEQQKQQPKFALPGLDSVLRPSIDPQRKSIIVTDVWTKTTNVDEGTATLQTRNITMAQNRVQLVPRFGTTERIRGGGGEEEQHQDTTASGGASIEEEPPATTTTTSIATERTADAAPAIEAASTTTESATKQGSPLPTSEAVVTAGQAAAVAVAAAAGKTDVGGEMSMAADDAVPDTTPDALSFLLDALPATTTTTTTTTTTMEVEPGSTTTTEEQPSKTATTVTEQPSGAEATTTTQPSAAAVTEAPLNGAASTSAPVAPPLAPVAPPATLPTRPDTAAQFLAVSPITAAIAPQLMAALTASHSLNKPQSAAAAPAASAMTTAPPFVSSADKAPASAPDAAAVLSSSTNSEPAMAAGALATASSHSASDSAPALALPTTTEAPALAPVVTSEAPSSTTTSVPAIAVGATDSAAAKKSASTEMAFLAFPSTPEAPASAPVSSAASSTAAAAAPPTTQTASAAVVDSTAPTLPNLPAPASAVAAAAAVVAAQMAAAAAPTASAPLDPTAVASSTTPVEPTTSAAPFAEPAPLRVQGLKKRPSPQWEQHMPGSNDEMQVEPASARAALPEWFKPDQASDLEQALLPEWFNGTAPHRTLHTYIKTRNKLMQMSSKLGTRYVTATMVRRAVPGDAGSLVRLHSFLSSYALINDDAMNDSAPTPLELQKVDETKMKNSSSKWDDAMHEKLLQAVVEESTSKSMSKRARLMDDDNDRGDDDVLVDWDAVAATVGRPSSECERHFLVMPILPVSDTQKATAVGESGDSSSAPTERPITPDAASHQGAFESLTTIAASAATMTVQKQILEQLLNNCDPRVVHAVTQSALQATSANRNTATAASATPTTTLAQAQQAAAVGMVASQALEIAESHEAAVSTILNQVVELRMQKLEHRMVMLDDVEGMLEAERVALELERRDLYTARCRHWFQGG